MADYFDMLAAELAAVPYSKAARRRKLVALLNNRSEQSIEFKHANISAVLIELGFPYISGYKPRANYQQLLYEVVSERLGTSQPLLSVAAADADLPMVVPEVEDILSVLVAPPTPTSTERTARAPAAFRPSFAVNYLEREARNRSLGAAGEEFVVAFEQARLIRLGKEGLAGKIEHTSRTHGDAEGFDILSFEESGAERLIEVKTTKYGRETPFFVSRNEVAVSEAQSAMYHLYRLFSFRAGPQMDMVSGALSQMCRLSTSTFLATVQ
ncbi:MAG: DUF3883 domain-containing protein [Burkholderiales bacterium]